MRLILGGMFMPFGYSNEIFPYPAVEYIPLLPIEMHSTNQNIPDTKPQLTLFTNQQEFKSFSFPGQPEGLQLNSNKEMGIALFNAKLEMVKYRGNYVTVLAKPTPGNHQILKVLTTYFYKSDLIFQLISPEAKVYSQKKLTVPIRR